MATISDLQQQLDDMLSGRGKGTRVSAPATLGAPAQREFSPFVDEDLARARDIASELMTLAEQRGGDAGLEAAFDRIAQLRGTEIPGLVQYAVMLFITHYPAARTRFQLLPLEQRQPNVVLPSQPTSAADVLSGAPAAGATAPEDKLSFWREDPLLNEHHEHWHLVYPMSGRPQPGGGAELGDRHGELFSYMHEQMIARYDAERLAAGLPPVAPLADYWAGLPQGYDPGALMFWDGEKWYQFRARPAGATMSDLQAPFEGRPGAQLAVQEGFTAHLGAAIETGHFEVGGTSTPVTIDKLGNTAEANINSIDYHGSQNPANNKTYGNLHNDGHIHLMYFDNTQPFGMMATTATAVRDPIFFRWHKQVDNLFGAWQEHQEPYEFTGGPRVKVHDIILCLRDGLPADFDGKQLGSQVFGSDWTKDFAATSVPLAGGRQITTTDQLITEMLQREIQVEDTNGNPVLVPIDYLSHDDFYYFIRVKNLIDQPQKLTVRIFLAPETQVNNRHSWIEMDRFLYTLDASAQGVIFQPADLSAVVRKPARKPADLAQGGGAGASDQPWCDCGWPYTMLLPRGTQDGMAFRLLVFCSPGADLDMPSHPEECTSISYCGLQDKDYPDTRAMGYPFDRPFAEAITTTISRYDTMASRKITIRCRDLEP